MGSWSCPNNKCTYDKQLQPRQDCPLCGKEAEEFEFSEFGNLLREKWDYKKSMERTEYPLEIEESEKIEEGEEIEESQPIKSEKVLGIIYTMRPAFMRNISEHLFITSDRVIVARTSGGLGFLFGGAVGGAVEAYKEWKKTKEFEKSSLESILKADKNNYAIHNSEIAEVKLWKSWGLLKLQIATKEKEWQKWNIIGTEPKTVEKRGVKIEDPESILRPVFGDKLSVKK